MKEQFPDIPRIPFEGPQSDNPLAFKFYNPDEKVGGKAMREHLRYSIAYWQAINTGGSNPFGVDTMLRHTSTIRFAMCPVDRKCWKALSTAT